MGMLNVTYDFPKMGRGGGVFSLICFLRGVRGGYFRFLFYDGVGSPQFYGFFSSGIGWSRIFVLKGEIERDMGRERDRGGVFAFFLRSVSSCVGLYSLGSGG